MWNLSPENEQEGTGGHHGHGIIKINGLRNSVSVQREYQKDAEGQHQQTPGAGSESAPVPQLDGRQQQTKGEDMQCHAAVILPESPAESAEQHFEQWEKRRIILMHSQDRSGHAVETVQPEHLPHHHAPEAHFIRNRKAAAPIDHDIPRTEHQKGVEAKGAIKRGALPSMQNEIQQSQDACPGQQHVRDQKCMEHILSSIQRQNRSDQRDRKTLPEGTLCRRNKSCIQEQYGSNRNEKPHLHPPMSASCTGPLSSTGSEPHKRLSEEMPGPAPL